MERKKGRKGEEREGKGVKRKERNKGIEKRIWKFRLWLEGSMREGETE